MCVKNKHSSARSRAGDTVVRLPSALRPILYALLCGIVVFASILMLFALIMSMQDVPTMLFGPMSVSAILLGCMAAGLVQGRFMRASGLVNGLMMGGLLYALIFALSLGMGEPVGLAALFKWIIALLSGAIGGIVGVNLRSRRRK